MCLRTCAILLPTNGWQARRGFYDLGVDESGSDRLTVIRQRTFDDTAALALAGVHTREEGTVWARWSLDECRAVGTLVLLGQTADTIQDVFSGPYGELTAVAGELAVVTTPHVE
jgi:hypothetical protein